MIYFLVFQITVFWISLRRNQNLWRCEMENAGIRRHMRMKAAVLCPPHVSWLTAPAERQKYPQDLQWEAWPTEEPIQMTYTESFNTDYSSWNVQRDEPYALVPVLGTDASGSWPVFLSVVSGCCLTPPCVMVRWYGWRGSAVLWSASGIPAAQKKPHWLCEDGSGQQIWSLWKYLTLLEKAEVCGPLKSSGLEMFCSLKLPSLQ